QDPTPGGDRPPDSAPSRPPSDRRHEGAERERTQREERDPIAELAILPPLLVRALVERGARRGSPVRAEPGCLLRGKFDMSFVTMVDRGHNGYDHCREKGRECQSSHGPRIRSFTPNHSIEGLDRSYPLKRWVLRADRESQNAFRGLCRSDPRRAVLRAGGGRHHRPPPPSPQSSTDPQPRLRLLGNRSQEPPSWQRAAFQ